MSDARKLRILFLGTPEFAAATLQKLINEQAQVVAVVTAPDKPAGRGLELQQSAVKQLATTHDLTVFQPEKLKDPDFLAQLAALDIDLGIVVAFRMLPLAVWQLPKMGTFNLHASLLPQYRGAAPINWAIINGETTTGITTFFLKHEIDTGDLLMQETVEIGPDENVGALYERLMQKGADLVWKTVEGIAKNDLHPFPQPEEPVKSAPKIFRENCQINFGQPAAVVHNFIRGLSPVPGAFTTLNHKMIKIFSGSVSEMPSVGVEPGTFKQILHNQVAVATSDLWYIVENLQPQGKRKMTGREFLAGHPIEKL